MPKQKRRQCIEGCIESIEGIEAGENGQNSRLPETAEDRRLEICGHWV